MDEDVQIIFNRAEELLELLELLHSLPDESDLISRPLAGKNSLDSAKFQLT
jgi:hypothetical protein